ncbi:hypothetical protein DRP53_08360 [candidate division WOR-3 bacterium]|uniref:Tetratricopeptide repeat protein n=1 Tax=candidate division WOR-3 bacterium TaxID=2052148 RepID=A0A660SGW5_UNCW3|nr:MAG: hypothetical protein DRP53_08360 [candidate division WOR-3 bacterium]
MLDFFGTKDPAKVLEKANRQYMEGKLEAAIKTLESGLTEAKTDFELLLLLARLYFENGQRMDTVTTLKRAYHLCPDRGEEVVNTLSEIHYSGRGAIETGDLLLELHAQRGEYEELDRDLKSLDKKAIDAILRKYQRLFENNIQPKKITDLTGRDIYLYLLYSYLLAHRGEEMKAVELLDRLTDREDTIPKVINLTRAITKLRWGDPYPYLLLTKVYLKHGEYRDALTSAQRAYEFDKAIGPELLKAMEGIKIDPAQAEGILDFKLSLYLEQKDIDHALPLLKEIYETNPDRVDEVIKGFRDLERAFPDDLNLKYFLGDLYLNAGRVGLAIEEYRKILNLAPKEEEKVLKKLRESWEKDPKNPHLISQLVELYLKRDELTRAVETVARSYEADPGLADEYIHNLNLILEKDLKNTQALYLLGRCLLQKNEWENAAVVFDNLVELGDEGIELARKGLEEGRKLAPDSVEIIKSLIGVMEHLGRFSEALGLVEEVASSREVESLVELVPKLDHIVKRAPELAPRAERIYELIKEVDPFLSTLAAAEARAASKDYEKAVEEYKKALEIDPEKREMIENIISRTLEGYPDSGPLTLFLARLYIDDGKMKEASDLFLKAHKRNPELVAELIDDYYQIIKDHPKDSSLRRVLVDALFTKRMFDQVLREAKEAIETLGGKEKGYFLLKAGQALIEKGDLSDAVRPIMLSLDSDPSLVDEAIQSLNQIVDVDRNNIPAHFALGRAYGVAKKIDKAVDELMLTARIVPTRVDRIIEELERLKSYSPASGLPYYARGFLYINSGRTKEGIEELDRAMEMDPGLVERILAMLQKLEAKEKSPLLYLTMAKAATLKGMVDIASQHYQTAFNLDPKAREKIIKGLKNLIDQNPDSVAPKRVLANIYLQYGALDNVIQLTEEIVKRWPEEVDFAHEISERVLKLDPDNVAAHYLLVEIGRRRRDYKLVVETLRHLLDFSPQEIGKVAELASQSLKESPDDLDLLLLETDILFLTGDISRVTPLLERIFTRHPEAGDAVLFRIKDLLKREKTNYRAYSLASNIFIQRKDLNKAIEVLNMAERYCLDPEVRIDLFLRLTYLYNQAGRAEEAKKALDEAKRLTPDRKGIFKLIKRLRDERIKADVEILKGKTDEKSRIRLAAELLELGEIDRAEEVLQFTPSSPRMLKRWALIKAQLLFLKRRPIDGLTLLRSFSLRPDDDLDQKIAKLRMEIAEALGFYGEALAMADLLSPYRDLQRKRDRFRSFLLEKMAASRGMVIEGRL